MTPDNGKDRAVRPGQWRASGDRNETERVLEEAALELIRMNGILAGLNLREVAETAEVNRGLVYHYFGSRRDLLRSAIRRRGSTADPHILHPSDEDTIQDRLVHDFRVVCENTASYELLALLVIDGDDLVEVTPRHERALHLLQRDVTRGQLRPDTDLAAVHVAVSSLFAGYALFRERFASEMDIPLDDLDARVAVVISELVERFTDDG